MSKQRRKHDDTPNNNGFDLSNMGNLLNNINPNQLAGMLNGIDMNQLSSMVQNFSGNQSQAQNNGASIANNTRSIELLNAIKPLVDAEKSQLIDSVIQLYSITKIIKK